MPSIKRSPEGPIIGERDDWVLFERQSKSSPAWMSLKMVHTSARRSTVRKRSFYLGFNGTDFARNHDAQILNDHYPDLFEWVRDCLRDYRGLSHGL